MSQKPVPPETEHPFIRPGHGNVVFNFRDDAQNDLAPFALGYRRAARQLAQHLAANGYADYDGYPICYLYRHAVELYLKAAILKAARLCGLLDEAEPQLYQRLFKEHGLLRLYTALQPLVARSTPEMGGVNKAAPPELKSFIVELDKLDRGSYFFRYPVQSDGTESHEKHFILNVLALAEAAEKALELLEAMELWLDREFDEVAEGKYAIQDLLKEIVST